MEQQLISWVWSVFAGVLSIALLVAAWNSCISVIFAIIGAARRRTQTAPIIIYLLLCAATPFLFREILWVSEQIGQSDDVSNMLLLGATAMTAIVALKETPRMLREAWQKTNG